MTAQYLGVTRRNFLIGAAAVGASFFLVNSPGHNSRIDTPIEGQRFLDALVQREPSQYAGKVIFDYDGSLDESRSASNARRELDDPLFMKSLIRFAGDPEIRNIGSTEQDVRRAISDIQQMPDDFKDALIKSKRFNFNRAGDDLAVASFYPGDFGKGTRSDIYFL